MVAVRCASGYMLDVLDVLKELSFVGDGFWSRRGALAMTVKSDGEFDAG